MKQISLINAPHLFEPVPVEKLNELTKEELIILLKGEQDLYQQMHKALDEAHA